MNALLGFPAGRAAMNKAEGPARRTALLVAAALAAAGLGVTVAGAPAASAAPPTITAFALGWNHSCALTSTGGVKCWGANQVGQLGDGTTSDRATPVDVVGLTSGVVAISAGGSRTCALTSGGGVKCWGGNSTGGVGDGTTVDRWTPVDVVGITSGATAVAVGAFHTCAVVAGGAVRCWGGNDFGELGNGSLNPSVTPVTVSGLSGATAVTAGGRQTCALTSAGGVKCWGHNQYGQVGDGSGYSQRIPVDVSGLTSGVQAVAAGGRHTCAVTTPGGAKCWGRNDFGQVGDGTLFDRITPVDVLGHTSGVLKVAAGRWQTCALTSGGGVSCWGPMDGTGDVGDNKQPNPQPIPGLSSGVVALAVGEGHACVAMSGGGAKCFGNNNSGKLGNGTTTSSLAPVDVLFEGTPAVTSTSTSLTSSPNPSTSGQVVTFTATVTAASGAGAPTGFVSFEEDGTQLGAAFISGGTATFTTSSLQPGPHVVTATYPGDANFNGSTSVVTQSVTAASSVATSTALTSSPNPSTAGQAVTFTATVTPASPGTPTGVVSFKEGATTLGTGTLAGGSATFTTSSLAAGTHTVTAVYPGDANFTGSTSPAVTQTVNSGFTPLTASINDVSVTEPDDGFVLATFTISLSRPAGRGKVTLLLNTADGTATAPKDYTTKSTTVTFLSGQSVKTVSVSVKGDLRAEPNETFTANLSLSSPTNATIADGQGVATILNDD